MGLVRCLTDEGRAAFRAWIRAGAAGEAPRHLLTEEGSSAEMATAAGTAAIVDDGPFASRLAHGRHLTERLKGFSPATLSFDEGVWDWLSLFYIDQLLPVVDGKRKPKEVVRYCLQLDGRKWSRHYVRMNWLSVREHGDAARVMLSGPMDRHPDILEQLSGQQEMFGSKGVIAAADALYWSGTLGALKKGHATRTAPGAVQRLRTVIRQFERTWDLEMLTAAQVVEMLPREFERWKPATGASAAKGTGSSAAMVAAL